MTFHKFAGKARDSESGNDYAMARTYVSRLARMASPDPIAGSVLNPQSLNRYAYVANDPADLIDPSGLMAGCSTVRNKTDDASDSDSDGVGMLPNEEMASPQIGCPGSHTSPWGGGISVDGVDLTDNSGMGISAFGGAIIFGFQRFGSECSDCGWAWIFALLSSPAIPAAKAPAAWVGTALSSGHSRSQRRHVMTLSYRN